MHDRSKLIQYCMITSCIPVLIITLHVLLFLCWIPAPVPPPVLLLPPPPANSGSNETSIWPVRKTQTSLPLWEEEPGSCSGKTNGTPDCQKKVNFEKKQKRRRADDDVPHAGAVSPPCFLPPWRAVLVWDEQVYGQGGKTGGQIKGNSVGAKCAKGLVRNGLWEMKKSPRMHCKSGKWCSSFMAVVGKCWKASWFVIRRISRNTNFSHQWNDPALCDFWTQLTVLKHTKCFFF